jgi:hypothetical protein
MTATAQTSVEAGIGVTFVSSLMASGSVTNATIARAATLAASVTGAATVTSATLDVAQFDPNFANVSLLLHGNGTNNSTIFTDNSLNNFAVTGFGDAKISTSQNKFGGSSIYLDGTGDRLQISANDKFSFGTGNFTVEMFVYPIMTNTKQFGRFIQVGQFPLGWQLVRGDVANNGLSDPILPMLDFLSGTNLRLQSSISLTSNNWNHLAITRSGTTVRMFVNGVISASGTSSANLLSYPLVVGNSETSNEGIEAYIDDLRITKGVARYTANFTPPTVQFPDQ